MKKYSLMFALFLVISTYSNAETGKFVIEGNIKNIPNSIPVTLYKIKAMRPLLVATDTVMNGRFRFENVSDSVPALYAFGIDSPGFPQWFHEVWVCNNTTKVTGDSKFIATWNVESNLKEQKEANSYVLASKSELDKWQQISIDMRPLSEEYEKTGEMTDEFKAKISASNKLQNAISHNDLKVMQKLKKADITAATLYQLSNIASSVRQDSTLYKPAVDMYNNLDKEQKESAIGIAINKRLFPVEKPKKESVVGKDMIDFTLNDLEGNSHTLSDIKWKYIILDFWFGTCKPCMMSIPEMKNIEKEYANTLKVVGISVDSKTAWEKASKAKEIPWLNLQSDGNAENGVISKYAVEGYPTYVLISPEYKILDVLVGYEKDAIQKFLDKNNVPK